MDTNEETNRFIDILDSMGIRSYDHNLPSALDEYARSKTIITTITITINAMQLFLL